MPQPPPHPASARLLAALRRLGSVATSAQLQAALQASQPTISRALAPLLEAGQVGKVAPRARSGICCCAACAA